jgi:adenylate cyclase
MARLILATAEGQQVVELRPVNSLGRHPNNSIQLLDKIVSKEHCVIEQRGESFVLRDLGSLNGTFINNERIPAGGERLLKHGDEITLGQTRARFDDGSGVAFPQVAAMQGGPPPGWVPPGQAPGAGFPQSQAGGFPQQPQQGGFQQPPAGFPTPHAAPSFGGAGQAANFPTPGQPGPFGNSTTTTAVGQMPPGMFPPGGAPQGQGVPLNKLNATRIEVQAQERAIGTQINAVQKGFMPFEQISSNSVQLRDDYERLRLSHELSREIAAERDTTRLLEKVIESIFRFTRADRAVIFLKNDEGELQPMVSRRRDGSETPITVSSTIMNHVMKERASVLTHDAAMDFAAAKGKSMILHRISSAIVVPLLHNDEVLGILWLDSESLAQFQTKDLEMVTAVANQAAMFIEINILGKKIEAEIVQREQLSRLVSPNLAESIANGTIKMEKGGLLVEDCTVFNSDIRGFTRMSEGTPPQQVVEMLNDYFEHMVGSIFKFEGTLDKFMGDGIMALWGAPVAHPDDAIRSVACALEHMEILGEFNRNRTERNLPPIGIGIGIHTGEVVAGMVGSSQALSYTVIGDTANTSARLCGIALSGQIIVSEPTQSRLGPRFEWEELPPAPLKGKEQPLRIFNIIRERVQSQVPASYSATS